MRWPWGRERGPAAGSREAEEAPSVTITYLRDQDVASVSFRLPPGQEWVGHAMGKLLAVLTDGRMDQTLVSALLADRGNPAQARVAAAYLQDKPRSDDPVVAPMDAFGGD